MSTEVSTKVTFQERLAEKIKDNIADLITPGELKKIIDSSMHDIFNKEIKVESNYGRTVDVKPPYIVTLVQNLVEEQSKTVVKDWISNHPDLIAKVFEDTLAKGLVNVAINTFKSQFFSSIESVLSVALYSHIQNMKQNGQL